MSYTIQCDTHTHTLFSRHAYSTIEENIRAAEERGLTLLASTDHFSAMQFPDFRNAKNYQYLSTCNLWPREWHHVTLLRGCEVDIVNLDGALFGEDIPVPFNIVGDDFPDGLGLSLYERVTKKMDYVIASVHGKRFTEDADPVRTTNLYIRALEHKKVLILGHIGRSGVSFDLDEVLNAAKSMHKLIEINEHSFDNGRFTKEQCKKIAVRCAELSVPVSISTDAHISCDIGRFDRCQALLSEIHFPEELIKSRDREHFLQAIRESGVSELKWADREDSVPEA